MAKSVKTYMNLSSFIIAHFHLTLALESHFCTKYHIFLLLSSVLSEDATQTQTFEGLSSTLHHYFTKNDHFKVGTALVSYLQQSAVPQQLCIFTTSVIPPDRICIWLQSCREGSYCIITRAVTINQYIGFIRYHMVLYRILSYLIMHINTNAGLVYLIILLL